jgi:hypothetical protein
MRSGEIRERKSFENAGAVRQVQRAFSRKVGGAEAGHRTQHGRIPNEINFARLNFPSDWNPFAVPPPGPVTSHVSEREFLITGVKLCHRIEGICRRDARLSVPGTSRTLFAFLHAAGRRDFVQAFATTPTGNPITVGRKTCVNFALGETKMCARVFAASWIAR